MKSSFAWPLAVVVCAVSMTGCVQPSGPATAAEKNAEAAAVEVVRAWKGDLKKEVEVPFTVDGYEVASLMARIDGYVKSVGTDIGAHVATGDVLAVLDVPEMDDDLVRKEKLIQQAEAQVALAAARTKENKALVEMRSVELKRMSKLVERGSVNQELKDEAQFALASAGAALARAEAEVDAAGASAEVAQAELRMARTMAGYREIRAPFDGLVAMRAVDPGAFVRPATGEGAKPLFQVVRVDKVRVVFYLSMEYAGQLTEQTSVVIHQVESQPGLQIETVGGQPLTIARSASSFDDNSRMMRVEIDVDNKALAEQAQARLKPGEYGQLKLILDYPATTIAPTSAVGSDINGRYVLKINNANQCEKVRVGVAVETEKQVGLQPGAVQPDDRLVAADLGRVPPGTVLSDDRIRIVTPEKE